MSFRIYPACLILSFLLTFSACTSDEDSEEEQEPDTTSEQQFERSTMIADVADNQIIPSYQMLVASLDQLQEAVDALEEAPSPTRRQEAQEALHEARLKAQKASFFEFGPAKQSFLRDNMMSWPADTASIEEQIRDEGALSNFSAARSLAAAEYLLYIPEDTAAWRTQWRKQPQRLTYLKALVNKLRQDVGNVLNAWTASDNSYRDRFVNELEGSSRGSALSQLINEFNYSYEQIKTAKVRIPAGLYPGNDAPLPEQVEAPYSRRSLDYIYAALEATDDLYNGVHDGGDAGEGLADYLQYLEKGDLVAETNQQYQQVRDAVDAINGPLYEAVETQPNVVKTAFDRLQSQVRYYKTDMTSATGVTINYADNDGD